MHPTILATQRGQALEQMKKSAQDLADTFDLDPALIRGLEPTAKDPQVRELQRMQGIAELLKTLNLATAGATDDVLPAPVVESVTDETIVTDGELPAPVVDDEPAPVARKRRNS